MKKFILLILLFCILVLAVVVGLLQTPMGKNKMRQWIEQKTDGSVTIGKIEGFLPFWIRLYDVQTTQFTADDVDLYLSPTTLLFGKLSLIRAYIHHADLQITESDSELKWPDFPLTIHSLKIDSLTFNQLNPISLSGRAEFSRDFSLQLNIVYDEMPFRLNLEGERNTQTVNSILHFQDIWVSGVYDWKTEAFSGKTHGRINSEITFTDSLLTISYDAHTLTYNIDTQTLHAEGPLSGDGKINWTKEHANLSDLTLHYGSNMLRGDLVYYFDEEQLDFALAVEDFFLEDPAYEVLPPAQMEVRGSATKEHVRLKGEVLGLSTTPLTLAAEIPLQDFTINRKSPFTINLKGRGSIDPLLAFLENASLIASGEVDVDLALTGTWDQPLIDGSLALTNGRIESLVTGAIFQDIHIKAEGEGSALKIRSLSAHGLDRGELIGTGEIKWNPDQGFPFELAVDTKHLTLLAVDPFTATVDSKLSFSGNIHEMAIKGNATIVEAHLSIPEKMPPQVPTLDVTYINSPKPEIEEPKKDIPITWDVQIEIPKNLTIDGRGLISEWRGNLHMYGEQDDLQFYGKLKLVQGRFTLVGRTFDLVTGKIQIAGLEPKDIVVDLKGDLEVGTITASINVNGSLDSANVAFTSNPTMSTNQILSWILFNQDVNELTPLQACRLANALVQLSGSYTTPSVWSNIKEGLGIDVFDITNCDIDSTDLTFQVGKYISQGTFVGVNKSISGDFDSVLIQTRLYRDFYLEADYGGSLNGMTPNGGKMIFKWYKSY